MISPSWHALCLSKEIIKDSFVKRKQRAEISKRANHQLMHVRVFDRQHCIDSFNIWRDQILSLSQLGWCGRVAAYEHCLGVSSVMGNRDGLFAKRAEKLAKRMTYEHFEQNPDEAIIFAIAIDRAPYFNVVDHYNYRDGQCAQLSLVRQSLINKQWRERPKKTKEMVLTGAYFIGGDRTELLECFLPKRKKVSSTKWNLLSFRK